MRRSPPFGTKNMKISYDSQADALYIKLQEGKFIENKEPEDGLILDIGKNNSLLGIEILDASKKLSHDNLSHVDVSLPLGVMTPVLA